MESVLLLSAGLLGVPEYDKQLHYMSGAALHAMAQEMQMTPLQSCLLSFGAGMAKEAWDSTGHGDVELGDLAATSFVSCRITINF